mgnify:CR=1 FL=1
MGSEFSIDQKRYLEGFANVYTEVARAIKAKHAGKRPERDVAFPGIADGVAEAARSEQIWTVLALNFGIGVFYVGPFMAVLPLVVRDIYLGGAAEIAYVNLAFWAGTIVAAFAFAGLARNLSLRGRLIVLAVSVGAVILFCMALQPPFFVLNGLCFVWGLGAGITLTQGRTVLQIVTPATHRARIMSLFQLGLGGGGPIGALIAESATSAIDTIAHTVIWRKKSAE